MTPHTTSFTGSIPENYDTYLGPLIFEFTAADMARRVADRVDGPIKLLEVACGTGISTRHLAYSLPAGSEIMATDLNPAMLAHAEKVNGALPGVSYSPADALDLPFEDASFDAVVCQFGIMFFPDKAQGLAEMHRVLKPGGFCALNVWDGFDANPSVGIVDRVIKHFFTNNPPRFLEIPFGTVTPESGLALYQEANFKDTVVNTVADTVEVSDYEGPARGFVTGNPTILEIQERACVDEEHIVRAAMDALEVAFGPAPANLLFQETVFVGVKV